MKMSPHICIGCNHRDCLRALAAFISSNDMMPSGLPAFVGHLPEILNAVLIQEMLQ